MWVSVCVCVCVLLCVQCGSVLVGVCQCELYGKCALTVCVTSHLRQSAESS